MARTAHAINSAAERAAQVPYGRPANGVSVPMAPPSEPRLVSILGRLDGVADRFGSTLSAMDAHLNRLTGPTPGLEPSPSGAPTCLLDEIEYKIDALQRQSEWLATLCDRIHRI